MTDNKERNEPETKIESFQVIFDDGFIEKYLWEQERKMGDITRRYIN